MKPKLIIPAALLLAGCATKPKAETHTRIVKQAIHHPRFVPKYDFSGHWNSDNSVEYTDTRRHGRHIVFTGNNNGYAHVFEGDYVDEQTIEGIQTRRKLADGTTTRMHLTITLLSPDEGRVEWVALDSSSEIYLDLKLLLERILLSFCASRRRYNH